MGLSGIQIFKMLPKTNCGDCGVPTCLAFGMNLAAGKAELDACPHVSDEARDKLAAESAPPILTTIFGTGDGASKVGGETVLYRHEKTFFSPTSLGVLVCDDEDPKEVKAKLKRLEGMDFERVGLMLHADAVALKSNTGDPAKFKKLAELVKAGTTKAPILMGDIDVLEAGLDVLMDRKPLLYAATTDNVDEMAKLAEASGCPVAVMGQGLDEVAELTKTLTDKGIKQLVIDPGSRSLKQSMVDHITIRRQAINEVFRPLGFPTIALPFEMADDLMTETIYASVYIAKYAGIVIMSDLKAENLFPLLLERLNIYTDPQRPMKTTEGIYELNSPHDSSPVLITSNFSLTYFIVSGEVEASRVPTWLLVLDTDGLSVLTAWAAGKFVGDNIGLLVKKCGIEDKVKKKTLVLPGYAAIISGDVEEEVGSDWDVVIGPREAAHIPGYLRQNYEAI